MLNMRPVSCTRTVATAVTLLLVGLSAARTLAEESPVGDPANPVFEAERWHDAQQALEIQAELPGDLDEALIDPAGGPPPPRLELIAEALDSAAKVAVKTSSGRRYNEVRQKATHNTFQKQEAVLDQLVYHRVRSVEFDIHVDKGLFHSPTSQNWYVYHFIPGDGDTTCHRLSDCLNELRAFHLANPNHEVVTVFLDVKDDWETSRNPSDLDARIVSHIPSSALWEPGDLMASCSGASTLRSAAQSCGWPYLDDLRGKFIFVLTGSDSKLDAYYNSASTPGGRRAFIAPGLSSLSGLYSRTNAVFYNLEMGNVWLADDVELADFVSRIYKVNNDTDWFFAQAYRAHHLATDKVNFHKDAWAKTHNANGWPFECFSSCSSALEEDVDVIGVEVNSEDIWGSNDHFRFIYEYNSSTATTLWTAAVNTRNSHTEEWAKGCLMARYSTASNSPYFAVCRPNDDHRLRIQWRLTSGGSSNRTDADVVPSDTIDEESITFVRLMIYNYGSCAAGYGSQDGIVWSLIGYKCYSVTLPRQGLASSSHDGGKIKFLYTNVKKNGALYTLGTFPYAASIGSVYSYSAFNGVFP